jgi:hypothetical protein
MYISNLKKLLLVIQISGFIIIFFFLAIIKKNVKFLNLYLLKKEVSENLITIYHKIK